MNDEYIKTLEKQNEELQNMLAAALEPSTENFIRRLIAEKRRWMKEKRVRFTNDGMVTFDSKGNVTLGAVEACRDLLTIRLNVGRQFGHSTAVMKIYNDDPINTCILVPTGLYKKHILDGITLDDIEKGGMTFTKKLILCDNFLLQYENGNYYKVTSCILGRSVLQGTPPIFVMT